MEAHTAELAIHFALAEMATGTEKLVKLLKGAATVKTSTDATPATSRNISSRLVPEMLV